MLLDTHWYISVSCICVSQKCGSLLNTVSSVQRSEECLSYRKLRNSHTRPNGLRYSMFLKSHDMLARIISLVFLFLHWVKVQYLIQADFKWNKMSFLSNINPITNNWWPAFVQIASWKSKTIIESKMLCLTFQDDAWQMQWSLLSVWIS